MATELMTNLLSAWHATSSKDYAALDNFLQPENGLFAQAYKDKNSKSQVHFILFQLVSDKEYSRSIQLLQHLDAEQRQEILHRLHAIDCISILELLRKNPADQEFLVNLKQLGIHDAG